MDSMIIGQLLAQQSLGHGLTPLTKICGYRINLQSLSETSCMTFFDVFFFEIL